MVAAIALTMTPNGSAMVSANFPTTNPTTPDTTPPTLNAFTPVNGATNVALTTNVVGTFSEPMSLMSLTPSSFSLDDMGLPVAASYTTLGNTAVLIPSVKLGPMQTYSAHITTGVKDLAGNALGTGANWTFRTQDGSWGFPLTFLSSAALFAVNTAVGRGGDVVTVWVDGTTTPQRFLSSRFVPGTGFSPAQQIVADGTGVFSPAIAVDPAGNAIAVWGRSVTGSITLQASRLTPGGAWSAPVVVENNAVPPSLIQVQTDAAGNALALWVRQDTSVSPQISTVVTSSFAPAAGWSTPVVVTTVNGSVFPALAVGPTGEAMAVWQLAVPSQGIVADRFVPATGWGTPQLIEADAGFALGPQVAIDPAGNAVAVWAQTDGTRFNVVANRFTPTAGWATPQIIDNDTVADAFNPVVSLDAAGNAIAAWDQSDGTRARVAAARLVPATGWGTPVVVGQTGTNDFSPSIAVDPAGNAVVVWEDIGTESNGTVTNSIGANRFTPATGWGAGQIIDQLTTSSAQLSTVGIDGFGRASVTWSSGTSTTTFIQLTRFE
jgi:hypothetical protein